MTFKILEAIIKKLVVQVGIDRFYLSSPIDPLPPLELIYNE